MRLVAIGERHCRAARTASLHRRRGARRIDELRALGEIGRLDQARDRDRDEVGIRDIEFAVGIGEPLRLEDFSFSGDELYLIALGTHVLWAGGGADLIEDPVSRARFRLAMDCADRVFRVEATPGAIERLTVLWDLEGAEPVLGLSAA